MFVFYSKISKFFTFLKSFNFVPGAAMLPAACKTFYNKIIILLLS